MTTEDFDVQPERGQISVLVLGLSVITATVAFGAAAVTSAHISRMQLLDAADAAALDAADAGIAAVYQRGIGEAVPLNDAVVAESAAGYLGARALPPRMRAWGLASGTGSPDGTTAVVRLTGVAELPLVGALIEGVGGTVTITVESRARAVVTTP